MHAVTITESNGHTRTEELDYIDGNESIAVVLIAFCPFTLRNQASLQTFLDYMFDPTLDNLCEVTIDESVRDAEKKYPFDSALYLAN